MKGYIHSIESLGTLDGPGLRSVVFLQGCPLKCKYCHNIDCALKKGGELVGHTEVVKKVMKNKEYWGDNGGVTISGGEPTFQPEFLYEIFKALQGNGVHTAIDSCLVAQKEVIEKLLPVVSYWMVSVKHMDDEVHKELTGSSNKLILENIQYLDSKLKDNRLRIRFLVIPGITDSQTHVEMFGSFVKDLKHLDVVELLKYGEHGKYKWKEIYGKYPLEGKTREATNKDVKKVAEILNHYNIKLKY